MERLIAACEKCATDKDDFEAQEALTLALDVFAVAPEVFNARCCVLKSLRSRLAVNGFSARREFPLAIALPLTAALLLAAVLPSLVD